MFEIIDNQGRRISINCRYSHHDPTSLANDEAEDTVRKLIALAQTPNPSRKCQATSKPCQRQCDVMERCKIMQGAA